MCDGWKAYKKYLIGQYKLTGDKWYRKSARKVDKKIKQILKENNESKQ